MKIAMVAAEFTGGEANGLRRAMATFRHMGTIHSYEEMMVGRMIARGYDPEFAKDCFNQIKGFGEYGFPESHAAAFAHLVYISAWIKCFYPDVFCAALLNSEPMGFYARAQIVRDARSHGVEILHPEINASDWDCTLEVDRAHAHPPPPPPSPQGGGGATLGPVRLGLRSIDGFREEWAEKIMARRPFVSLDDLRNRAELPAQALDALAAADALFSLTLSRRGALWAAKGLPRAKPAPLFAAAGLDEADGSPPASLPAMPLSEEVVHDYETIRLSLKAHPMSFLRARFAAEGVRPCADAERVGNGGKAAIAGVVLVRQRPGSAKGVCFITLEDETGITNIVVWPKVFETFRPTIMGGRLILVRGRIQRAEGVTHLVADEILDRTADLALLSDDGVRLSPSPGDGANRATPDRGERDLHRHPRDVRILQKSRDFH
jgi:error-prone DNA polymerase